MEGDVPEPKNLNIGQANGVVVRGWQVSFLAFKMVRLIAFKPQE